jgi:uncharacterized protein (TIGR03437 family)
MRFQSFAAGTLLLGGAALLAQVPDVKSLSGKYFFRELALTSDTSQVSSVSGTLTFDGNGSFTFQGQQLSGTNGPVTASGQGTYLVSSSGSVVISPDPLRNGSALNARIGAGALVASNTESSSTFFNLMIAIPAPTTGVTNAALNGRYWIATLELPSGSLANVRDAFIQATANAAGGFGDVPVTGEISGGGPLSQTAPGSTYSLNSDGSGTANFPAPASSNPNGLVLTGTKTIYASQDGSIFIGGGTAAGAHGIMVGIKAGPSPNDTTLNGIYFGGGISASSPISAFVGAASSKGDSNIVWSRRYVENGNTKPLNVSAVNNYTIGSSSGGFMLSDSLAISNGNFIIASGVQPRVATNNFELIFAVQAPSMSGTGVFLNPLGVFNAASFAPVGYPISPGELITLYGTGFPAQTAVANSLPLPVTIGGVQVLINGAAVPMFSITSDHVSAMVPFTVSGSTATVVVSSGGKQSNTVTVPVAASSPGLFTATSNGLGSAAILHPDFTLVSPSSPARRGEIVQIYLTGLGPVTPAITAGTAAPTNPLSLVPGPLAVYINGVSATITFQGLAPTLVALYQINVVVPATVASGTLPLAVQTADGFTDEAAIVVQ